MAKRFGSSLTDKQFALARAFERAGLTTISQAVKAFERGDDARIVAWKAELNAINNPPAPVVEPVVEQVEEAAAEVAQDMTPELVTVKFEGFEMDMTAETTDEDIEGFVGTAKLDFINEDEIAARAWRLAHDRGFYAASGHLTDADEIEAYLLASARAEAQARIDGWVSGLINARDEVFGR